MKLSWMRLILPLGLLAVSFSYKLMQVQAAPEPGKGIYTADQAKAGDTLYQQQQCALCHGSKLEGAGQSPPLAGDEFLSKYQGQPMAVFFDKIQKSMPATNPGSLTRPQTAQLIAFILKSNAYVDGPAELPSDNDSLKKLELQKP